MEGAGGASPDASKVKDEEEVMSEEAEEEEDASDSSEEDDETTIARIQRAHFAAAAARNRRRAPARPRAISQKRKMEAVKSFHDFTKKLKKDTGIAIRSIVGRKILDLSDLSSDEESQSDSDGLSEAEFEVNPSAVEELHEENESYIDPETGDIVEGTKSVSKPIKKEVEPAVAASKPASEEDPETEQDVDTEQDPEPEPDAEADTKDPEVPQTLSISDLINEGDLDMTKTEIAEVEGSELCPDDKTAEELLGMKQEENSQDYDITEKLKDMGEISVKPVENDSSENPGNASAEEKKTDGDDEKKNTNALNVRRNIRDVMDEKQLDASTLAAQRQESERLARVQEQQRIIREVQRQIAMNRQNKVHQKTLQLLQGGSSLLKKGAPGNKLNLPNTVLVKLPSGETKKTSVKQGQVEVTRLPKPTTSSAPAHKLARPDKKEVVEIVDSSSGEETSSSSSDSDDCIMLSDSEVPPSPEPEDDPNNSGLHVNDAYNIPDEQGRVQINVGHPEGDDDIFLAPQIARIIKPHQIGGVRFLFDNIIESVERFGSSTGFGCILAHSMGLGKTLQIVCFCDIFLRHTSSKTVLCIMPINTLQNWMAEFNKWLPADAATNPLSGQGEVRSRHFPIYVLNDSHKTLQMRAKVVKEWSTAGGVLMIGYELYRLLSMKKDKKPRKKRKPKEEADKEKEDKKSDKPELGIDDTQGSDVTSQSKQSEESKEKDDGESKADDLKDENPQNGEEKKLLDEMYEALVKPGPDLVICDEGHRIKNSHSNISYALKQMRTKRRVVLTGYPLQNNLLEYWCMVDFVRPNYLGSKTEFCNMFERPIQNGQCIDSTPQDIRLMRYRAHVLHSLLVGFVQRRSHAVLQSTLPQKEEFVLLVRLTPLQRKLYDRFMNEVVRSTSVPNPLKAFAICCKIWNHPDVLYNFLKKRSEVNAAIEEDLDLEEIGGVSKAGRARAAGKTPQRRGPKPKGAKGAAKKPAATIPPNTTSTGPTKQAGEPSYNNAPYQPNGQPYGPPAPYRPDQPDGNYPPYPNYQGAPGYYPPNQAYNQNYGNNYYQQQPPYGNNFPNQYPPQNNQDPAYNQSQGQSQGQGQGQNYWGNGNYYNNAGYYNNPQYPNNQPPQDYRRNPPPDAYTPPYPPPYPADPAYQPPAQPAYPPGQYQAQQYPGYPAQPQPYPNQQYPSQYPPNTPYPNQPGFDSQYNAPGNYPGFQGNGAPDQPPTGNADIIPKQEPGEFQPIVPKLEPNMMNTPPGGPNPYDNQTYDYNHSNPSAYPNDVAATGNPGYPGQYEGYSPMETKPPLGSNGSPVGWPIIKTEVDRLKAEDKAEIKSESDGEVKIADLDTKTIVKPESKKGIRSEVNSLEAKPESIDKKDDSKSKPDGGKSDSGSEEEDVPKKGKQKGKGKETKKPGAKRGPKPKAKTKAQNRKDRKKSKEKNDDSDSDESEKEEKLNREEELALVKKAEEMTYDWAAELLKDYIPGIIENSAKMELFFYILNESIKLGDRLLLFSQSLFTLNLIEDFLERNYIPGTNCPWERNTNYYRLDGSTHALEREKLINEFNSNPHVHLFLVSTRAGSLGINLVGANRVIVFDASWNPCHDTQAVCRVYRYGQKKPCFVYRFVMDWCLEKKIYDRQINKQGMADRVVDECNPDAVLSMKEITNLCFDNDEKETEIKDLSEHKDKYIDVIMQGIILQHGSHLSKEPFQHESLLVDRKEKKLSSAEKRLAQRGYELEKKAAAAPKPTTAYRTVRTADGSIVQRPVASVRPMQHGARWIPADVWRRQGMTAQEMTLPLDVVIPTNSAEKTNIVLKAGQRVMVLKSPKGIYMQLESGKIIAIKTSLKGLGQKAADNKDSVGKKVLGSRPSTASIPGSLKNNSAITITSKTGPRPGLQRIVTRPSVMSQNRIVRPVSIGQRPSEMRTKITGADMRAYNARKLSSLPQNRLMRPNLPGSVSITKITKKSENENSDSNATNKMDGDSEDDTHVLDSEDEDKTPHQKPKAGQSGDENSSDKPKSNEPALTPSHSNENTKEDGNTEPLVLTTDEKLPSEDAFDNKTHDDKSMSDHSKSPQSDTMMDSTSPKGKINLLKNYRHQRIASRPAESSLSQLEKTASALNSEAAPFRKHLDNITQSYSPTEDKPTAKSRKKKTPTKVEASDARGSERPVAASMSHSVSSLLGPDSAHKHRDDEPPPHNTLPVAPMGQSPRLMGHHPAMHDPLMTHPQEHLGNHSSMDMGPGGPPGAMGSMDPSKGPAPMPGPGQYPPATNPPHDPAFGYPPGYGMGYGYPGAPYYGHAHAGYPGAAVPPAPAAGYYAGYPPAPPAAQPPAPPAPYAPNPQW